jgi:GT2 family glycosyltransferase
VRRVLEEFGAKDKRIRLHFGENRGVSHASNRALEMASGEFVVLLDHDDVLEEQALFRVAESIVEDRPDMVYSDEVLVTPDASTVRRYAYRPAFSLEYLRSHPYIVHLVGFRTQILRDLGGFDESLRISQDYDLILRVAEKARTIVHIPEILYQWRLHAASAGKQRMDEVMQTSKAVLQRHLDRLGEAGMVHEGAGFNLFDVRYPLEPGLRVAIVIPTKNHFELLRQCIDSIRATVKGVDYDIVVVDHESDERATRDYLDSIAGGVRVLRYEGVFNFSAINNWAVKQVAGRYTHYLFCNNDIEAMQAGWLERMLELGQQPSIGIVGAKLLYGDRKTIQHGGVCVGAFGAAEHYGKRLRFPGDPVEPGYAELLQVNHEVAAVTAACMLVREDAFREVGGFDEAILVGFGDVDLCLRVGAKGYRILFCPHAELLHHESSTRGTSAIDPHPADSALYRFKWRDLLRAGDPYHSPGLSLYSTNWMLKQPLHCDFGLRRRIVKRDSDREEITFSAAGLVA